MRVPSTNKSPVESTGVPGFWRSRHAMGLVVMGAVAGYFSLTEHLAHTLGALPYLLLAACPLMHVFMHHGHAGHEHPLGNGASSAPLATAGPYAHIRHPQYMAFAMILLGFLLQWPTLLTLLMFPVLLVMYGRLALAEEADMRTLFGQACERYASVTPRFIPSWPGTDSTLT